MFVEIIICGTEWRNVMMGIWKTEMVVVRVVERNGENLFVEIELKIQLLNSVMMIII